MENFVVINGRILDFDKYKKDFSLLQKIIVIDLKEYFLKLGFSSSVAKNKKLVRQKLNFYNEELDMEIVFVVNKKEKPDFI